MDVPRLGEEDKAALRGWLAGIEPRSSRRELFRGLGPSGRAPTTRPRGGTYTYHQGSCRGVVWHEVEDGNETLWMLCIDPGHDPGYAIAARLLEAGDLYPDPLDLREREADAERHEFAAAIATTAGLARANVGTTVAGEAAGYWFELMVAGDGIWSAKIRLSRADADRDAYKVFGFDQARAMLEAHLTPDPEIEDVASTNFKFAEFVFLGEPVGEDEWMEREIRQIV